MALQNLKEVIANLPLILCSSDQPKDVSLNRVITVATAAYLAIAPPFVLIFCPQNWAKMIELWNQGLLFLGAQTAANIGTKIINKGGQ